MKRIIFLLMVGLFSLSAYSQYIPLPSIQYQSITPNANVVSKSSQMPNQIYLPDISYDRINTVLEDGWYNAKVTYHNPNTGTKSTYSLKVKVFDDSIVNLNFGNEGSLHSGYNESGYTYSGGNLSFYQNKQGEIVSAETTVNIYRNGYTTTFQVKL